MRGNKGRGYGQVLWPDWLPWRPWAQHDVLMGMPTPAGVLPSCVTRPLWTPWSCLTASPCRRVAGQDCGAGAGWEGWEALLFVATPGMRNNRQERGEGRVPSSPGHEGTS